MLVRIRLAVFLLLAGMSGLAAWEWVDKSMFGVAAAVAQLFLGVRTDPGKYEEAERLASFYLALAASLQLGGALVWRFVETSGKQSLWARVRNLFVTRLALSMLVGGAVFAATAFVTEWLRPK